MQIADVLAKTVESSYNHNLYSIRRTFPDLDLSCFDDDAEKLILKQLQIKCHYSEYIDDRRLIEVISVWFQDYNDKEFVPVAFLGWAGREGDDDGFLYILHKEKYQILKDLVESYIKIPDYNSYLSLTNSVPAIPFYGVELENYFKEQEND